MTSAPQGNGIPGWLYLTRNPKPIAYWIQRVDNPTPVPVRLVLDERCFEETILRVEKTPTHLYIADIWMWNGIPIFCNTSFDERQTFLKSVYEELYTSCPEFETYAIQLRSNLKEIRGRELYTNDPGARGIFVEDISTQKHEIVKTDIPDVYKIVSNGEYLRVKTMLESKTLRKMGNKFMLSCKKNDDGTWTPIFSSEPSNNENT